MKHIISIKQYVAILLCGLMAISLSSCEKKELCMMVHPHDAKNCHVTLTLNFNTAWDDEQIITPYSSSDSEYDVRYTLEFWTVNEDGSLGKQIDRIQQKGATLVQGNNTQAISVDLPSDNVRVLAWADYVAKGSDTNTFFDITSLQKVILNTPYGAIEGRDAFLMRDTWDLSSNIYERNGVNIEKTIDLKRCFAKYKVYTNDAFEYINEQNQVGASAELPAKNKVRYQLYFPTQFNINLMMVINPDVNVTYDYNTSIISEGKTVVMAEDYILVSPLNADNSYYNLIIDCYDKNGSFIKTTKNVNFPVKANRTTITYGFLLTNVGIGSPGIDDSFDQEIIVPLD